MVVILIYLYTQFYLFFSFHMISYLLTVYNQIFQSWFKSFKSCYYYYTFYPNVCSICSIIHFVHLSFNIYYIYYSDFFSDSMISMCARCLFQGQASTSHPAHGQTQESAPAGATTANDATDFIFSNVSMSC